MWRCWPSSSAPPTASSPTASNNARGASLRHNSAMAEHPREGQWRLADAQAAQAEWRAVSEILLRQGEAVFASRRWRWGSRLSRPIETLLRWCGRDVPAAQDIAHWRDI